MIDKAIEKLMGRRVDFKKEVILEDDGTGVKVKAWNLNTTQPSLASLQDIYNQNKDILDLDSKIRLSHDVKLVVVNGEMQVVIGYFDTVDVTSEQWEAWRLYSNTLTDIPTILQVDSPNLPQLAQDGAVEYKMKYVDVNTDTYMDASSSIWVFNPTSNSKAYLPDASNCLGRMYQIKNKSNKSVTIYPINNQKIDSSNSMSIGGKKNATIISYKDISTNISGWLILENP
jgi:hypothetical protein